MKPDRLNSQLTLSVVTRYFDMITLPCTAFHQHTWTLLSFSIRKIPIPSTITGLFKDSLRLERNYTRCYITIMAPSPSGFCFWMWNCTFITLVYVCLPNKDKGIESFSLWRGIKKKASSHSAIEVGSAIDESNDLTRVKAICDVFWFFLVYTRLFLCQFVTGLVMPSNFKNKRRFAHTEQNFMGHEQSSF